MIVSAWRWTAIFLSGEFRCKIIIFSKFLYILSEEICLYNLIEIAKKMSIIIKKCINCLKIVKAIICQNVINCHSILKSSHIHFSRCMSKPRNSPHQNKINRQQTFQTSACWFLKYQKHDNAQFCNKKTDHKTWQIKATKLS